MNAYTTARQLLASEPKTWLVTGVAGFIGSNLLEALLTHEQRVIGLDNFATGHRRNLDEVHSLVSRTQWANFSFIEGDIRNLDDCGRAMRWRQPGLSGVAEDLPVEIVLHQAALGSVPRSIEDPISTNQCNIDGFLNMLVAARDAKVHRFVYAASSSTYGDHPDLPKVEDKTGNPLSPYAVTKLVNELYAKVFSKTYGLETIGLRYFNVFGPRQDPDGAYAAVIPRWINRMITGQEITIFGDGDTSRDFCFVANAVQANLLAATCADPKAVNQIYNVAVGERTTLKELAAILRTLFSGHDMPQIHDPIFSGFRSGDVRHSLADISKAGRLLRYAPSHRVREGLEATVGWHLKKLQRSCR